MKQLSKSAEKKISRLIKIIWSFDLMSSFAYCEKGVKSKHSFQLANRHLARLRFNDRP